MIRLMVISFAVLASLGSGCNKEGKEENTPKSCIDSLKEQIQNLPPQTPPATIWQYTYNGSVVYLVPAPCCDRFNPLYNVDCEIICHPDGGITGKGDGKCNYFHSSATDKELLWKDTRSAE
jgi:hypothetical protein